MKVLSFGEILLRLSAPGYTKLFQTNSLEATFCGGEANVAVSLANFGIESAFMTKLPKGPIGQAAEDSLHYFGVDTNNIVYGDGRLGLYYLEKGASQRPSKIIYDRKGSSFSLAHTSDFTWDKILQGVHWFHWTGINPALSTEMPAVCMEACKSAKEMGITISCDLNYRKMLWSSKKALSVMTKLMPFVDVCIANEEDIELVLGIKPDNNNIASGKLNKSGYKEVAEKVCDKYGCKYVAITLRESYSASVNGWSGMLYDHKNRKAYYSTKYDIQIVDRVGGGDSFAAGIIYGLLKGMNNQDIIEYAVAASCLQQTIEGDYNRETIEDVEDLLEHGGNGRVQR